MTKHQWPRFKIPNWKTLAAVPRRLGLLVRKTVRSFPDQIISLRLRLTLMFLAVALIVWLAAGGLTWRESREQLDEFFDSYQILLAHQLAAADWKSLTSGEAAGSRNPLKRLEAKAEAAGLDEDDFIGRADDDALSFAVFDRKGQLIFSDGDQGTDFPFEGQTEGLVDRKLNSGRKWRLAWIKSPDGQASVVVGQRLDYRSEASLELAVQVLMPWLIGFFFLTAASIWMVSRELRPLKDITGDLRQRVPDDLRPLTTLGLPSEVAPLGLALNGVFQRLRTLLARERAFVSDASHELRSPLAALKVQVEVAQLSHDDPPTLDEALANLNAGIDRTARLVEQLLALSRLDSSGLSSEPVKLDWNRLIEEAVIQTETPKKMTINCRFQGSPALAIGHPVLISLMLRNLLDNARRYSPDGATIDIVLDGPILSVTNTGVTMDENYLRRLGERFFRPPGQEASGSGLGLSIVRRAAELHGLEVSFRNVAPNSFSVTLTKSSD